MAEIILPGRFSAQPQAPVELAPYWRQRGAALVAPLTEPLARDIVARNNFSPGAAVAPVLVTRNQGRVLYFNGSTTRLESTRAITPGAVFTAFAWCRPAALSAYARLVETDHASGFFLGLNTAGKYCWIVNNGTPEGCVGGVPTVGQRDFVCGVFDGSNRILYVNGVQVASSAATAPTAARTVYIGAYGLGGAPSYAFNGDIDTVGIFDRVFAPAEIFALYQNPWQLFRAPARTLRLHAVTLAGSSATQANSSSADAIGQDHALAAAGSSQPPSITTGAITQVQMLAAAEPIQVNLGSLAAISVFHDLAGSPAAVAHALDSGQLAQAHVLAVAPALQDNAALAAALIQGHFLTLADLTQANSGISARAAQGNLAGSGIVTQIQYLVSALLAQPNRAREDAISDGVEVEAELTTGIDDGEKIKKPGIPADAPDWLRTMFEILTGRRGNKFVVPPVRQITFSATPTKAECEALYAYLNEVRATVEDMRERFDS